MGDAVAQAVEEEHENEAASRADVEMPPHIRMEYECGQRQIIHHNERLWSSAPVFITGALISLGWLASRDLTLSHQAFYVAGGSSMLAFILLAYMRMFRSWVLLDRIEFYRVEEIEREHGLRRSLYTLHAGKTPQVLGSFHRAEAEDIKGMQWVVAHQLETISILPRWFRRRRALVEPHAVIRRWSGANKAFTMVLGLLAVAHMLLAIVAVTALVA